MECATIVPGINRQLPSSNEIFLDHVAHFVTDIEGARRALTRAGFAPTPVSVQLDEQPDRTRQPSGTGNITAMLEQGYIEVLFKTADTPLGREIDSALSAYPGVHLIALAAADARREHCRLANIGFRVRPLVEMQRPVTNETGATIAVFTVARVEPGEMAEGRIQILTHHTEAAVWQTRWLTHPNGARGLIDVLIVVDDIAEAAARFSRFADRPPQETLSGLCIALDRGAIFLVRPDDFARLGAPSVVPALPFIAIYGLRVGDLDATQAYLGAAGLSATRDGGALTAAFPAELGIGVWVFGEEASDFPWRRKA